MTETDWNPETYARFAGLRLRPALDLVHSLGGLPEGPVCDLGCGTGAAGPILAARFPEREINGVDSSPAMLDKARESGAYAALDQADIAAWRPERPQALIFSNAALHWVPDHPTLLPRLAGFLAPGGTLAVQVPRQNRQPSHRIWLDLVEEHFPGRIDPASLPGVPEPVDFHRLLSPLGDLDMWETEYFQPLPADEGEAHPVRAFTSSTFARPILERLDDDEAALITRHYDTAMEAAYPRQSDGTVLFPFRRFFFTLDIG